MQNLLTGLKFTRIKNAQSVATADVTSDAVDMAGFESAIFVVAHGTITDGTPNIYVQQSSDDGGSDAYSDLEGTSVATADADDNKLTIVEVNHPRKRYLKLIINRGGSTGSVVDGIIVIQGFPRVLPVTQSSTVGASEIHNAPAEGTA